MRVTPSWSPKVMRPLIELAPTVSSTDTATGSGLVEFGRQPDNSTAAARVMADTTVLRMQNSLIIERRA